MKFDAFEAAAQNIWTALPAEFKQGVDGLVIERDARSSADESDIYTLGECVTETFPSTFDGPDTTRSVVLLYYGSFLRLSIQDPEFDWEHELHETITHELQHHLESLANEDTLQDFDYAVEQNFKRLDGEAFDPLFFRAGEQIAPNVYQVEQDIFVEVDRGQLVSDHIARFDWEGKRYALRVPTSDADVTFVEIDNPPSEQWEFCVVVVANRGTLKMLSDLIRRRQLSVRTTSAFVEVLA